MTAYAATPIDQYLKRQGPGACKLLVVRGYSTFEEVEANWMVDQTIRGMRSQNSAVDVSDMTLSAFRVLGAVSNDPNDESFNPKDQLPIIIERLTDAQVVLLASHEAAGFPDGNQVRLAERIHRTLHNRQAGGSDVVAKAFAQPKMLGVLVYGGSAAYQAANTLAAAWCRFGCNVPAKGVVHYDMHRGDITKAGDIGNQLMGVGRALLAGVRDTPTVRA